jgi:hypothetical protein
MRVCADRRVQVFMTEDRWTLRPLQIPLLQVFVGSNDFAPQALTRTLTELSHMD